MPVILTTPDAIEAWLKAPTEQALTLQQPLPDGALGFIYGPWPSSKRRALGYLGRRAIS